MNNSVPIGATSKVGWGLGTILLVPTFIKSLEEGNVEFQGPQKWLAVAGAILITITHVFRYLQSLKLIPANVEKVISTIGEDFENTSERLPIEGSITPDQPPTPVQATRPVIDSPQA